MKALINCAKPECAWPSRFFGSINPYMLPVLGKPLIEYYLDWCSLSGIQEVLVVAEEYDEDFADFVSNGSKWGLDATVSANSGDASDEETLKRNSNFADGGVSVMSGFFFPYYDKTAHRSEVSEDPEKRIYTNAKGPRKHDYCKCKPIELESLEKYYKLCMSLLSRGTRHLTINGYGSEPGVFMGMNIVVMPEAKLEPPFVIGNNVQIEAYTRIGPCVVVGDTCIVDRRTSVENSIVLGKTYIAQDLEIRGKILFGILHCTNGNIYVNINKNFQRYDNKIDRAGYICIPHAANLENAKKRINSIYRAYFMSKKPYSAMPARRKPRPAQRPR